jgi:ABC-type spermidine/putrescine transport system permease subunit I
VFHLFTRHTTHRGMIHSLPVAATCGIITAAIAYWLYELPPPKAWLAGSFVTLGFITHLLLDEISAINLFGIRSRRSFGTAMKLWYRNSWRATLAAYIALILTLPLAPPVEEFQEAILKLSPQTILEEDLLPEGGWFAI